MPLDEHETAVEHYEAICNAQLDEIAALKKQLTKVQMELAMAKQMLSAATKGAF